MVSPRVDFHRMFSAFLGLLRSGRGRSRSLGRENFQRTGRGFTRIRVEGGLIEESNLR